MTVSGIFDMRRLDSDAEPPAQPERGGSLSIHPVCQSSALARGAGQGDACSRTVSFRCGKAHDCDSKRRLPEAKTSDKRRHATGVGVWEQPTGSQVLWRLDDEVKHSC
jgi:hypothetical protein